MYIGYARVSTQDQDTALQLDALRRAGCESIFEEKASGSSRRGRRQLARCLASLCKGDVLVVYKIDRVARSLFDLLEIVRQLEAVGAAIKSVTEPLDTASPMGVFMLQMLGAVAQLERSMIRERSIAGQLAARERGRMPGRARALSPEDEACLVREYLSGLATYQGLGLKYGVSAQVAKRAVYRVVKAPAYCKGNKV